MPNMETNILLFICFTSRHFGAKCTLRRQKSASEPAILYHYNVNSDLYISHLAQLTCHCVRSSVQSELFNIHVFVNIIIYCIWKKKYIQKHPETYRMTSQQWAMCHSHTHNQYIVLPPNTRHVIAGAGAVCDVTNIFEQSVARLWNCHQQILSENNDRLLYMSLRISGFLNRCFAAKSGYVLRTYIPVYIEYGCVHWLEKEKMFQTPINFIESRICAQSRIYSQQYGCLVWKTIYFQENLFVLHFHSIKPDIFSKIIENYWLFMWRSFLSDFI